MKFALNVVCGGIRISSDVLLWWLSNGGCLVELVDEILPRIKRLLMLDLRVKRSRYRRHRLLLSRIVLEDGGHERFGVLLVASRRIQAILLVQEILIALILLLKFGGD